MTARRLVSLVLVALVYLFVLASFDPWDALAAVLAAAAALAVAGRLPRAHPPAPRPTTTPLRFAARLVSLTGEALREITVGTWHVSLVVLHLRPLKEPGIVAVPVGDRSEAAVAAEALIATLAPGEFFVDLDRDRQVLLFHVLDASDPDDVRRRHAEAYERLKEVLP